jgi:hypothetical protein
VPLERCLTYRCWYYAFHHSRSGEKLRKTFGEDWLSTVGWENASPKVGRKAADRFPYDAEHIRARLAIRKPKIVLAFGEEAENGLRECWEGDLICCPHPAYMLLTNDLMFKAKIILNTQLMLKNASGGGLLRTALRQLKGSVLVEDLTNKETLVQARV